MKRENWETITTIEYFLYGILRAFFTICVLCWFAQFFFLSTTKQPSEINKEIYKIDCSIIDAHYQFDARTGKGLSFLPDLSNTQLINISSQYSGHEFVTAINSILMYRLINTMDRGGRAALAISFLGLYIAIISILVAVYVKIAERIKQTLRKRTGGQHDYISTKEAVETLKKILKEEKNKNFIKHANINLHNYCIVNNLLRIFTIDWFKHIAP